MFPVDWIVAGTPPKVTDVTDASPRPWMTTVFPPQEGPASGSRPTTAGGGLLETENIGTPPDVPDGDVTTIGTSPAEVAGVFTVRRPSFTTLSAVPAFPPKVTDVALVNPLPVSVTVVPPNEGPPHDGDTDSTRTASAYSNWLYPVSTAGLVPYGVVTVTAARPVACAGAVAVIDMSEFTVTPVAGMPSNETVEAPVKPMPAMRTGVPPTVGPLDGTRPVTAGKS